MFGTDARLLYVPGAPPGSLAGLELQSRCCLQCKTPLGELVGKILKPPTNALVCLKLSQPAFVRLFAAVPSQVWSRSESLAGRFTSARWPGRNMFSHQPTNSTFCVAGKPDNIAAIKNIFVATLKFHRQTYSSSGKRLINFRREEQLEVASGSAVVLARRYNNSLVILMKKSAIHVLVPLICF